MGLSWQPAGSAIRTPAMRMESITCGDPSHEALAAHLKPSCEGKEILGALSVETPGLTSGFQKDK